MFALVPPYPLVHDPPVPLRGRFCGELNKAYFAQPQTLLEVHELHVLLELILSREVLVTHFAEVQYLSIMYTAEVSLQVIYSSKRPFATGTHCWWAVFRGAEATRGRSRL
mmetsp:Transcript_12946/g.39849  ORF Transcript_12946/g.39849 Transcript_12946/m.39849 type:complete len:110 (-) Transcript_12946:884-1213(-)